MVAKTNSIIIIRERAIVQREDCEDREQVPTTNMAGAGASSEQWWAFGSSETRQDGANTHTHTRDGRYALAGFFLS